MEKQISLLTAGCSAVSGDGMAGCVYCRLYCKRADGITYFVDYRL